VLTTQARVDETRLRRKQTDLLPKLIEIMQAEKKKLPARTIEGETIN
jgi:hypothetical protein